MTYKAKNFLIKIAVIIAAGFLDFAVGLIITGLKVPLFFDTIFVIAVLLIYGPVESIFVYIANRGFSVLRLYVLYGSAEFVYLYSLSAITIVLITFFLGKHLHIKSTDLSVNQKFIRIVLTATIAAIACSVVSGLISYFTYQFNSDDWAFDKLIFSLSSMAEGNMLKTFIIGRIPLTVLDRIITTFAGYGVYLLWRKAVHEK